MLSCWMVIIMLMPLIVMFQHQHERISSNEKSVQQFNEVYDHCDICAYEFSSSSMVYFHEIPPKQKYNESYPEDYHLSINKLSLRYSFLLRAPPVHTN